MPIICSKKATRPKYNLQSASQLNSPSAGPVSPVNLNESTIYPAGPSQEALGHRKPPLSSWSTPDAGGFTCYGGVDQEWQKSATVGQISPPNLKRSTIYATKHSQDVLGRQKTLPDHPPGKFWRLGVAWDTFGAKMAKNEPLRVLITSSNLKKSAIYLTQRPQGNRRRRKTLPDRARDKYRRFKVV